MNRAEASSEFKNLLPRSRNNHPFELGLSLVSGKAAPQKYDGLLARCSNRPTRSLEVGFLQFCVRFLTSYPWGRKRRRASRRTPHTSVLFTLHSIESTQSPFSMATFQNDKAAMPFAP